MSTRILPTAAAVGALIAAGCGSGGDGAPSGAAEANARGTGVDRAFTAQMVPHHKSAVEMARIAQARGKSEFVKDLADTIVRTQNAEISTLRAEDRQLAQAGVEPGDLGVPAHMTGMADDPAMLRTAKPFDPEFLSMMIPHHAGAVSMARAELATGSDPELKQLAQRIADDQQREIAAMRDHLKHLEGDAEPSTHGSGHSG